ncbi:MAG: baseplate J/gp47 family protein [Cytophagales bacterium]|jgi:hypothetical protein|nr:baseplate J/gp47 family protein [Cytophagales bacterium]
MPDSDQQNDKLLLNNNKLLDHTTIDDFIIFLYFCTDIIKFPHKKENYWEKFLISDNIVIYSLILHTDTNFILKSFSKDVLSFSMIKDIKDKLHILDNILKSISDILTICIYWYENLTDKIIKGAIEDFLSKNVYKVQLLYEVLKNHRIQRSKEVDLFFEFVEKKLKTLDIEIQQNSGVLGGDVNNSIKVLTREINENSLMLIVKLQKKIPKILNNELFNGEHNPHMTLLFTYYFLMKKVGEKLNDVVDRHLEYYFEGVLCEKKKGIFFDKTLVFCNLLKESKIKTLGKDVSIFGGQDDAGQDVTFRTSENTDIYKGKIDTIYTLEVSDINISTFDKLPQVSLKIAEYNMERIYENREILYLFSPERSKSSLLQNTKFNDNFGIVISSHILFLSEGNRTINLKFHAISESLQEILEEAKTYDLFTEDNALQNLTSLFLRAVQFKYSTPEGWQTISKDYIKSFVEGEHIILSLLIDDLSPSFSMPFENKNFKYENPSIKIVCQSSDYLGYAILFLHLKFDSLEISVDVKGCKNLVLQNDLGLIENKISFYPFGAMPNFNSSFYIGSQEIFNKNLKSLHINIEWQNLPKDGGFIKYYKNYPGNISGESFVVNVYSLRHQKWIPNSEEKISANLFESKINTDRSYEEVSNKTVISNLNLQALDLTSMTTLKHEQESYSFDTQDGFIKFELASPDDAFGHFIYPKLISGSNVVKNKYLKKMIFNDINDPYTPVIKNLSIDFSSAIEYKFDKSSSKNTKFFSVTKLNLFGEYKELFNKNRMTLFDFAKNSYSLVYVGIKDVITEKYVSLYVRVDDTSVRLDTYSPPLFCFLNGNFVCPLSKENIIEDETFGLRRSGKILIEIPQNIETGTLLDNNKFWFSIMFDNTKNFLPTILGIYLNPIKVVRSSKNSSYYLKPYVLSNIMDRGYEGLSLIQPFESYGGKDAENDEILYKRICKRLRHKDRGVTAWDYENLILANFPQIAKVKCFNNKDSNDPNNVTIVVVNKIGEYVENGKVFPQVSQTTLEQIKAFIKKKTSAFSEVRVINPAYERIQFGFYLKIKTNYAKEQSIQNLNNTIKLHISPWIYRNNREDEYGIEIGKEINTSDIINFINSQNYVEGLSNFVAIKYEEKKITEIIKETNIIKPKNEWSVFYTSAKQMIRVVNEKDILKSKKLKGIDNFEIENDFIISPVNYVNNNNYNIDSLDVTEENSIDDYYLFMRL